jgi:hypothetical protein
VSGTGQGQRGRGGIEVDRPAEVPRHQDVVLPIGTEVLGEARTSRSETERERNASWADCLRKAGGTVPGAFEEMPPVECDQDVRILEAYWKVVFGESPKPAGVVLDDLPMVVSAVEAGAGVHSSSCLRAGAGVDAAPRRERLTAGLPCRATIGAGQPAVRSGGERASLHPAVSLYNRSRSPSTLAAWSAG